MYIYVCACTYVCVRSMPVYANGCLRVHEDSQCMYKSVCACASALYALSYLLRSCMCARVVFEGTVASPVCVRVYVLIFSFTLASLVCV